MPLLRSLVACMLFAGVAGAADWPQWLGPNRDGSSTETVAPWKETPRVAWRVAVGEGHAGPLVVGDKVFLLDKVKDKDAEAIHAYDTKTGKELWHHEYARASFTSIFGNGPRGTPTIADGRLYSFGVTGVLTCLDIASAKVVWQVDTQKDFQAPKLTFGASCSPLIVDNLVLVNVGAKGASLVAFTKDKGTVAWKCRDDGASYSSPIVIGQGDARQAVFLTAEGLVAVKPADGTVFWNYPLKDKLSESSTTPVHIGDLLLGSSVTRGSVALKLQTTDGKPSAVEAWKSPALTCYFSTPVAVGTDHLYIVTGSIVPGQAALQCVEAKSGKSLWTRGKVGSYHASLLKTGANRLLMLDDAGNLMLLEADPKEYKELARSKVCGATWAHPALANGRLYVRDNKELICLELGK